MALTLPSGIPTSICSGNSTATATWASSISIETQSSQKIVAGSYWNQTQSSKRIEAGDYWKQANTSWEFTFRDQSLLFHSFGVPGAFVGVDDDPNFAAQKNLGLSKDNKTLTLSVPYPTQGGTYDIFFNYGPYPPFSGKSLPLLFHFVHSADHVTFSEAASVSSSGMVMATGTPTTAKNPVDLLVNAKVPCLDPAKASNPTLASSCADNQITPGPEAWTKYEAPKYMASILSVATPLVDDNTHHQSNYVDGAKVIHEDANPAGPKCTYTAKCDSIGCRDVRGTTSGSKESIQRYLANQAVVNYNNYLWSCYDTLFHAGTLLSLNSPGIVTTFFSNPTPDASWQQIVGGISALLGVASSLLGPASVPFAGLGFGALSSIVGIALGQAAVSSIAPIVDARFSEYSTIEAFAGDHLGKLVDGIQQAYDQALGPRTTIDSWTGPNVSELYSHSKVHKSSDHGTFGDGIFSNNDFVQDLGKQLLPNMAKIFTYKAINFAWKDSGVFVIFVPYGRDIKGPDGDMIPNFSSDYCKNHLSNARGMVGKLINCDAGGGMAALFNAAEGENSGYLGNPQGFDKPFNILTSAFSIMGAIEGSVASWRKGDFDFDAGDPYKDALGKLSDDQLHDIAKMNIDEKTAGFFNIPVCQVLDLRFFPYATSPANVGNYCTACDSKAAVGGTPGSKKQFFNAVNKIVKGALAVGMTEICGLYGCLLNGCPHDTYEG
ncbi:MAG: hypothetical protein M1812_005263 [Candelaria pacifica]|nr:MAG: hypothetical protein M1812_005263 [Candelaria pacifica]